jgi:Macrocin-O-methyltransferase (TylF)
MSRERSLDFDPFDDAHYASTFLKKIRRSLHLGPKYFLWDLPAYFSNRVALHLPLADFRVFLNPLKEFRQRIYHHFDLPPQFEEGLQLLATRGVRLTMPRNRLEAMTAAWWATVDVPGDVIECGSFQGATVLLLALLGKMNRREQRMLILDTFSGLPEVTKYDNSRAQGEFLPPIGQPAIIQQHASALGVAERIEVHQGLFADTFTALEKQDLTFAFVHIDANIYSGTRDACEFTIPRTHAGGIVVFDDYNGVCDLGARLAIDEYFACREVKILPLAGSSGFYNK